MPAPRPPIAMLVAAVLCGALLCVPAASGQAPGAPAAASLVPDPGALRGHVTRFHGVLPDAAPAATVQIQRLDPARGWVVEASTTAGAGGAFVARWRPRVLGRFTVRAVAVGPGARAVSRRRGGVTCRASAEPSRVPRAKGGGTTAGPKTGPLGRIGPPGP